MKNTYIALIVLVVIVGGAWFLFGMGNKAAAPVVDNSAPVVTTTPTPTSGSVHLSITPPTTMEVNPTNVPPVKLKEFTVIGKNYSFTPSQITVKKGDMIKITFQNDNGFHNLVIDEFNVSTPTIKSGAQASVQFVANKTGSFQYYCSFDSHRAMGMWGTLKVE